LLPLDNPVISAHLFRHDQARAHHPLVFLAVPLEGGRQIIMSTGRRQAALLYATAS
jgi:hypothetical protein